MTKQIDTGAQIALTAATKGAKVYIMSSAEALKTGVAAAKAAANGDFETAAKLGIKAGLGWKDAQSKDFKAGLRSAVTQGLDAVGLSKLKVIMLKAEKALKKKQVNLEKAIKARINKNLGNKK